MCIRDSYCSCGTGRWTLGIPKAGLEGGSEVEGALLDPREFVVGIAHGVLVVDLDALDESKIFGQTVERYMVQVRKMI